MCMTTNFSVKYPAMLVLLILCDLNGLGKGSSVWNGKLVLIICGPPDPFPLCTHPVFSPVISSLIHSTTSGAV